MVAIANLDRATVIQALYAAAQAQGLGLLHYQPGPLPYAEAQALVGRRLGYLYGRVLQVKITNECDEFDEQWYDRDNGEGAAQRVVHVLRAGGAPDSAVLVEAQRERTLAQARAARDELAEGRPEVELTTVHTAYGSAAVVEINLPHVPEWQRKLDEIDPEGSRG